jgi:2-dehydro-3-deoxygluconokinase
MKMKKVVTFGEVMMRLTPCANDRVEQATSFDAHLGGSEYNVAAGLCALGHSALFVTKLPDNPLGRWAERSIRANGVELLTDTFTPEGRLGIYFLEKGASPRPNKVTYDRAGSAFSLTGVGFDWDIILADADWFHVSGITPALGANLVKETSRAIGVAKVRGVPVSIDLNYRTKLWSPHEARAALEPFIKQAKVLISTEEDLGRVFDIEASTPEEYAVRAWERFGIEVVAVTLRETPTVLRNRWGGCAYGQDGFIQSTMYDVEVIDRVGAGDAFTAGFIAGMLDGDMKHAPELAAAFSAIKQTIPGDVCLASRAEVEALIKSGGAGRIQR